MKAKRLRELSEELVTELGLDDIATTETMCQRLREVMEARLGRPITLRFDDLGDVGVSGLWAVAGDDRHVIIVTDTRSWIHRLLILLHEVAHMLCGHRPLQLGDGEGHRVLYPDLSHEMLTVLAGRTNLTNADEREADQVAGFVARALLTKAHRHYCEPPAPQGNTPATRSWYTFGFTPDKT